ncbi:MAG: ATP-binding protein [Nanoarchaeota archaeon]
MATDEELIKAISELNFWGREQPIGRWREGYVSRIQKFLPGEDALVILGVRRAGKTYLARQILKKQFPTVRSEQTLYLNFEDPQLGPYLAADVLEQVYRSYRKHINPKGFAYVVLDEVHAAPQWEKWVRGKQERKENLKIIITGSNARLLRKEISSVLTGRTIAFEVFPLSFSEFLLFQGRPSLKSYELLTRAQELQEKLTEYLRFGGFPKVVLAPEEEVKLQTLKELFEDLVVRDVIVRNKIREAAGARLAAELVVNNFSCLLSANKLRNTMIDILRTKISPNFVVALLAYFEEAFLFFQNPILSYKIKEQKQYPKKTYVIDSGIINATTTKFSENYGLVYENAVAIELLRRHGRKQIFYWKNPQQEEVDFVVKEGLGITQLIQVCFDLSTEKALKRELRGLLKAAGELQCHNLLIITNTKEGEEEWSGETITFRPLWKWLLAGR